MSDKIVVGVPNVKEKMQEWIDKRGGVKVWKSINLSNGDAGNIFTPADVQQKPRYDMVLDKIVVDINDFRFVKEWVEVERFHVALRRGSQGLMVKCTDGSTRRIRNAQHRHPGSFYRFDYMTQEAVIEKPVYEEV